MRRGYYQYFGTCSRRSQRRATTASTSGVAHGRAELQLLGGRGCDAGSPQEQWLRADSRPIAAVHARGLAPPAVLVRVHGSDSTYTAFWQALYDAGADVVLSGHDHDYERFAAQTPSGDRDPGRGCRQFVVGRAEGVAAVLDAPVTASHADATSLGVLELTLGADAYAWRFRPPLGSFTERVHELPLIVSAGRERP